MGSKANLSPRSSDHFTIVLYNTGPTASAICWEVVHLRRIISCSTDVLGKWRANCVNQII
jgi:hypothetical protein